MVSFVSYSSIDATQVGSISERRELAYCGTVPRLWAFLDIPVLIKAPSHFHDDIHT